MLLYILYLFNLVSVSVNCIETSTQVPSFLFQTSSSWNINALSVEVSDLLAVYSRLL